MFAAASRRSLLVRAAAAAAAVAAKPRQCIAVQNVARVAGWRAVSTAPRPSCSRAHAHDAAAGGASSGQWNDSVDLRSDTLTKPSPAMRQAMANAEVGDDVFGEDPTITELEEVAAALLGHEQALFVPSGSMGNLISVSVHCARAHEIILGTESHIFRYEQGGAAAFLGVPMFTLANEANGELPLAAIQDAIRDSSDPHMPITAAVALENTQNRCGGQVLRQEYVESVRKLCDEQGLKLHMDGARIANAAVALGLPLHQVAGIADSISMCLSKGLGCPVGSVVAGSEEYVYMARRARKAFGGGMRQAGVLAAAGLVALRNNIERLADDHAAASAIAHTLAESPAVDLDPASVTTNIIYWKLHPDSGWDAPGLAAALEARGVHVGVYASHKLRAVTHLDVSKAQVEYACRAVADALQQKPVALL